jgi:EmrB/QacA subfamily drug resistance transporter
VETDLYSKKYQLLAVSALAAFISTLDASIVNVSLPTIARHFSVSVDDVAWVILAYSLTITATLLLAGRTAVKYGYRMAYFVGFSVFTTGSFLCALSGSATELIIFRILQGIGATYLMASGPALITRAFPANERGKGMGILGTVVAVGLMSGPPLGGFLVSAAGWEYIFVINIPVGLFGVVYSWRLLKILRPDDPKTTVDYIGGIYQGLALVLLLAYFNRMNSTEWPQWAITAMPIAAVVLAVAFILRERRAESPLVGLLIFGFRDFTLAISAMVVAFIALSSAMVLLPFYLEEMLGLDPSRVGLILVVIPLCTLVFAPIAGRISDSIGVKLLTTLGFSIFAAGMFWMSTLTAASTRSDVIIRLLVTGTGLGIFQAPNSSALMSSITRKRVGIASGLLGVGRNLGLAGGVAVSTAIFAYRKSVNLESLGETRAFMHAFTWVIVAFGFLAILGIILCLMRSNRPAEKLTETAQNRA